MVTERVEEIGTDEDVVKSIGEDVNRTSSGEREAISKRRESLRSQLADVQQNRGNWLERIGSDTAKKTGSVTSLLEKIGQAEKRRKELDHQPIELEEREGELQRKVLQAASTGPLLMGHP